jgi:hypothetical protein
MKRLSVGVAIFACVVAYQQCQRAENARTEAIRVQEEGNREAAEAARQQAETNNLLREQLERDECAQFMRVLDLGDNQAVVFAACANPDSPVRVRLRSRR